MKKIACCLVSFAAALCAIADDFSLVNKGSSSAPVAWSDISNWTNRTLGAMADRIPGENDHLKADAYVALDGDYTIDTYLDSYAHLHVFRTEGIENTVSLTVKSRLGSGAYQRYNVYNGAKIVLSDTATLNGANGDANPTLTYAKYGGTVDVFCSVNSRHSEWFAEKGGTINYSPKSYSTGSWQANHFDKFHVAEGGALNFPVGLNVVGGNLAIAQINHNSGTIKFGGGITSICGWLYTWKAGEIVVTEDSVFPDNVEVVVAQGAEVSVDVASGKTFKIENISFADDVSFVKTGDGMLGVDAVPGSLAIQGGGVRTSAGVPSVSFAGGELELVADFKSIPIISSMVLAEGAKAKIKLSNLYLLPVGEYTIVESGNTFKAEDYEFEFDPSVIAEASVKDDGSVVLTVSGLAEDLNPLVWRPENLSQEWDYSTASWMQGEERLVFVDGTSVFFDGTEANYTEEIYVNGSPNVKSITFGGDRDYLLSGERIDTCYVVKQGTGKLAIDGNGFSGKDISLIGGELQLQPGANEFVKEGVSLVVPEKSAVSISTDRSRGRNTMSHLFRFEYISGSADWDTRTEYTTKLSVDSISDFINVASPKAPDGVSLSGKSVFVSGYFYVSEEEAGEWSFKGIYDDGIALWVDGAQLFKTANYQDTKTASVDLDAGWHEFKIRAYDGSGGWGMANCLQAKTPIADDYVNFHEKNFQMNWYGSAMDSNKPLDGVIVDLSVGAKSTLTIRSPGYVVRNLELSDDAMIAIDPHSVPANKTFVSANDADTLSILKAHIQHALGDIGKVVETSDGLAWEMEAVFESDSVTDLMDKNGWKTGILPDSSEDVTIRGVSTKAVMGEDTTAFNSISLADGASLTVNAEREIPKISLAAGTSLNVSHAGETMMEITIPGFLSKDEIKVGDIDPSVSLADIADITGLIGGANWNAKYKGLPYEKVEVNEDGDSKLVIKFIHFEKPYKKGVLVELRKEDGSLYVKAIKAVFEQDDNFVPGTSVLDLDFSSLSDQGVAISDDTKAYGVRDFSFKYPHRLAGAVTVTAADDFVTAGEGSVIVDVAEGCMLDLSKVNVETGAKLVKTGLDAIFFGNKVPSSVEIAEGAVELLPYVEYDMSGVVVGENVVIKVRINGKSEDAAPLVSGEKTKYVSKNTYIGVGSWNEASNWAGGELPAAGDCVFVYGEDTELMLDDAEIPTLAAITVEDSATVTIVASTTLNEINLAPTAKLMIGDNEAKPKTEVVMNFAPNASIRVDGERVTIPSFHVATNATIKFSLDAKLKNLDMVLCGTATTTANNVGGITFGYAENGEVSYFALYADGATIHPNCWESPRCTGHFVWPEAGGRVVQLSPYYFRKCNFPCAHWADYTDPRIGINNPLDEKCEIVFDSTAFYYNQWVHIGGAAKVRCINGASIQHGWGTGHIGTGGAPARLQESASIELEGERTFFSGYGQSARFAFNPSAEAALETPALTLKDGASIKGFHLEGNGNAGLYIVNDGEWTIPKLYLINERYQFSPVLQGFDVAIVAENSVFRIVGRDEGGCNTGEWLAWDRKLTIDGDIGGYGDVLIHNAVAGNFMEITVTSPINTCEGAIRCDGENDCSLLFADGANWAGTVVAGNVSLTNLTDGAAAASVDFAKLDLAADFPVRVWRKEDGTLASDVLNVGEYINNGGVLLPVMMTEGSLFDIGDKMVLGKINNSTPLPKVGRGWVARTETLEGEEDKCLLVLKYCNGFKISIR